jgi:hypothetical protein
MPNGNSRPSAISRRVEFALEFEELGRDALPLALQTLRKVIRGWLLIKPAMLDAVISFLWNHLF